ncbi:MAG: hypothetical protein Q9172_004991 [Xanthocarpia lactea]
MPAQKHGSNDLSNRDQRRPRPMVAAAIPGQWYERLNEIGPGAGHIPFDDDEPPFHLQRPLSNGGSTQSLLEEPVSSRLGENSQPQPLSHSLLSRLELGENDPDTFRDIIDDLTVQNKSLERQLKRFVKTHSIGKEHNGLFEVRIHNLPPDKKHELEAILRNFTATIHSSQYKAGPTLATTRGQSLHQVSASSSKLSPPSPPSVQALDSAYASASATGVTIPAVPDSSTCPSTDLHKRAHNTTLQGNLSEPRLYEDSMILDRNKQEIVVKKLEQLFDEDPGDVELLDEKDEPLKNAPHWPQNEPTAPLVKGTSVHRLDENVSTKFGRIDNAGAQPDQSLRTENFLFPGAPLTNHDLAGRNASTASQPSPSPDHLRHLRHLGVASPISDCSPQSSHDWVYLNLLANAAQLHTLNVTPKFVRQAIHDLSTKLILSDDGRKVRWRGNSQDTGLSPDESHHSATKNHAVPLACSPGPSSGKRQPQDGRGLLAKRRGSVQQPATSYLQDTASSGSHPSSTLNKASGSSLQYRPMFTHSKRQLAESHCIEDGQSVDSDTTSSADDRASMASETKMNNQSAPMIFVDRDPFFLDLSADPPGCDRIDRAPYGRLVEEPLGGHNGPPEMYREPKKRSSYGLPPGSEKAIRRGTSLHGSTPSPSLTIYDNDPSPSGHGTMRAEHVQLEASGIGNIQLDDNFAIDVTTEQSPLSQPVTHKNGRALQTSRRSNRLIPSCPSHHRRSNPKPRHRLVSTKITHLPPSPLPPPSYIYPALSSSSSDFANDGDLSDDVRSESELEFRPMSLSPQMRMFLESEDACAPEEDDEDMGVGDEK